LSYNGLKKNLNYSSDEKRQIIEPKHSQISIRRQCELIGLNRSNFYYEPQPIASEEDLELMKLIDEEYMRHPFYGTRKMARYLNDQGHRVNRKRVQRLYRIMGIQAVYPKRNLSKSNPAHKVYPYLLRGLNINRSNQVWCIDITYIRLEKGFAYLTAIMDWHSRYVLNWTLSPTLEGSFCVDLLRETIQKYGAPEIFNSDQGSQFTSPKFTQILKDNDIKISMDGKGRALDNVFIERLWRSVKYECVYLRSLEDIQSARDSLNEYLSFYNKGRHHQALGYRTPAMLYHIQKAA
jgi:putative transposase